MGRTRVYIADIDNGFVARVRRALSDSAGIEVIGNCANGRQALMDISRLLPDVVLTDIPLPELDGIALLREVRRLRRPPEVIVCTRFCSDTSMQCACRYGAAFFLCKPVELQALPELIAECGKSAHSSRAAAVPEDPQGDIRSKRASIARTLLKEIGMPARLDGSAYILEAASLCRGGDLLFKNLSQGLYEMLASRMDTTASRIERSLRSAIAIAYERGSLNQHFSSKPSNKTFLEFVVHAVDSAERAQA